MVAMGVSFLITVGVVSAQTATPTPTISPTPMVSPTASPRVPTGAPSTGRG